MILTHVKNHQKLEVFSKNFSIFDIKQLVTPTSKGKTFNDITFPNELKLFVL